MIATIVVTVLLATILVFKRTNMALLGCIAGALGALLVDSGILITDDLYRIMAQSGIAFVFTMVTILYYNKTKIPFIKYTAWAGWALIALSFVRLFSYIMVQDETLFTLVQVKITELFNLGSLIIAAFILFTPDSKDMIGNVRGYLSGYSRHSGTATHEAHGKHR